MSQTMTDVQRAMWQGWYDSGIKLSKLQEAKPSPPTARRDEHPHPSNPIIKEEVARLDQEWSKYRDDYCDWKTNWNIALGYRDAMHKACEIIKVPNFGNHD
jgi:hypothetical protein